MAKKTQLSKCLAPLSIMNFKKYCLKEMSFESLVDNLLMQGYDPIAEDYSVLHHVYFDLLLAHCLTNIDTRCNIVLSMICEHVHSQRKPSSFKTMKSIQWCGCFRNPMLNTQNKLSISTACSADCMSPFTVKPVLMNSSRKIVKLVCDHDICEIGDTILYSDSKISLVQLCPQCKTKKCTCTVNKSTLIMQNNSVKNIVGIKNVCGDHYTSIRDMNANDPSMSNVNLVDPDVKPDIGIVIWSVIAVLVCAVVFVLFKSFMFLEKKRPEENQFGVRPSRN